MTRWYIIGDSHIGAFERAAQTGLLRRECSFLAVTGATAVGLRNPNAATNALQIFCDALVPSRPQTVPVIQLGEVDCGFVIWYRACKHGETIEVQVTASIEAYFDFVDHLLDAGYPEVIITGATLPTIRDGHDWGARANKRREVTASLSARTALTLDYNQRLKLEAGRRGLTFIDIAPAMIDPATGVIAEQFRHPDPRDLHLHPDRAARLWAEALNGLHGDSLQTDATGRCPD